MVAELLINQANKPVWFSLENPVDPFIGRSTDLSELKLGQLDNKITIITGPRGMGKSELTRKYAQDIKHDNSSSILWLDAKTHKSLVNSFKDLAVHIGNTLEGKTVTSLLRETFEFFHNRKALFILDHAFSDNIIIKNLQHFLSQVKKVNVIVTSRDEDWNESYKIINLKPFTKENSLEYLRTVLQAEINMAVVNSSALRAAELLENLPLALSKATQHIIHKNTGAMKGQYTIDDYIQDLLNQNLLIEPAPVPQPNDEEIEESIYEKISQESKRIGDQIGQEASNAWETITDEADRTGRRISDEADRTGRRISDEAARIEEQVRNFFSFG